MKAEEQAERLQVAEAWLNSAKELAGKWSHNAIAAAQIAQTELMTVSVAQGELNSALAQETLEYVRAQRAAVEETSEHQRLTRLLIDDGLPGKTIGVCFHDGQWVVQQMYTGLEEESPTDVCGMGDTLLQALQAAVERGR